MDNSFDFQAGEVLLIDKPMEWTSFDVVKKVRGMTRVKKVGHAGTLDPLATGLLIICTGKKTKSIEGYQAQEKEYEATMRLGVTSESHDLEQELTEQIDVSHITAEEVEKLKETFTGDILQIPPMHSAVKVDGKRAYSLARKGKEVKIDPRQVTIRELEFQDITLPEVTFRVVCTKGTYIRSLVRDMGEKLGAGAVMTSLRRTRIGEFDVNNAWELKELEAKIKGRAE
ncbi:tRNA pseudouridine(55) synthase TruB [Roseivirga sp. BDSF3-8]|uniref:tRNA pseudouridine(55) synthase TruB n=1 Tax=Roseivirga sp. BDSF3-8 TaxID=3241598 RepID=UPI00353248B1